MSMTKCLRNSAFTKEEQQHFANKADELVAEGMTQKEAEVEVATKFKNDLLSSLKDIYTQLDISTKKTTRVVNSSKKQTITDFIKRVASDSNILANTTRQQRDNAIIDISREIWSHPNSSQKEKNSNFQELKDLRDEIKEKLNIFDDNANPIFPRTDATSFEKNNVGSSLLSIAALNNPAHANFQYTNLEFKNDFIFDGDKSRKLNLIEGVKGDELVSSNFQEFLAAMADNVKSPTANYLNLNTYTVNTYLSILHTGFKSNTGIYFINQPVLRELYQGYQRKGGTISAENKTIKELKDTLIKIVEEDIPHSIYMHRTSDLRNQITDKSLELMNRDEAKEQLKVLYTFLKYKDLAQSLSNLIIAIRSDSQGTGQTMADNHFYLDKMDKIRKDENLVNQNEVLDKIPLIQVSTEYGLRKPQEELLSIYLPFNGKLFTKITDNATIEKGGPLTSKEIKYLYTQFIHWYVSGFDFFKSKDKDTYVNDFPKHFHKTVTQELRDKFPLLQYLRFVPNNKNSNKVDRIEFTSGATVSDEQRELLRQSWEAMLASDNEVISKLGKNLIRYAFYTTNLGFTNSGFSHLIPPTFFENAHDSNQFGYRDYLYKLMDERDHHTLADPFLEEVYQNGDQKNGDRLLRIIPNKQITNKSTTKKSIVPSLMFNPKAAEEAGIVIKQGEGDISNINYLRYKNANGNIYTYKYAGYTEDGNIVFNILQNKGYENHIVEFNKDGNKDSVLPINKLPAFEEKDYFGNIIQDDDTLAQLIKERDEANTTVDKQLNTILNQFVSALGIETRHIQDLKTRTGLPARGIADIFNRLILISQNKEKLNTLPEEVGHFAEAYMRHDPIHNTLMGMISQTETYQQVVPEYNEAYHGDQDKLKQEAIGQLIGEAIIKRSEQRRNKTNNVLLQFLEALWNKFIGIFKKADPNTLMKDINSITDYIADQVLDINTKAFKIPSNIKLGERFFQLIPDANIRKSEDVIIAAMESINKKIQMYASRATREYAATEQKVLTDIQTEFDKKNYELGLIRYVDNARVELGEVAKRYNSINQNPPITVEEKRNRLNQLKAASNYVNGFKDTLQDIAKLNAFDKATNENISALVTQTEKLGDDYLLLGKALVGDILRTFSTNSTLDVQKALEILDGDISFTQRWLDAMAETSDPILGILDKIVKDSKEIYRRKTIDLSKDMIDNQVKLEKAGIKSTGFYAERDFAGNLTGNRVSEYNIGEYNKQKRKFFKDNPKSLRENYLSDIAHIFALKDWSIKAAKWFEENNQSHPDKERIMKEMKAKFDSEYSNPIVAKEKYEEWVADSMKEVWSADEFGPTLDYSYRNELSLPAEKYKSEQWKDIQANPAMKEYANKVTTILDDLDKLVDERYRLNGKLPQVRKDFYERLFFIDSDGKKRLKGPLDIAKETRTTIADAFIKHENDIEFGLTDENNVPINFVPVYWTKRIDDPNNLSTDITSSVVAFASSVHDHKAMMEVLGTLEVSKDILAERAILTGKWDKVTLMSKITKLVNGKEVPVVPISTRGEHSLSQARLKDYMEMVVFGRNRATEIVGGINIGKVLDTINRYTALNSLAGNIYSGISNITFGTALERTEAIAGEFYGHDNLLSADKIYTANLVSAMADIGQRQSSSILNLWEEVHNTLQNYNREFKDVEAERTTMFSRLVKESSLYFLNHSGEHYMQLRSSIALAHRVKVKTKEGKIIPYWEAYDKINVGTKENPSYRFKLKEGLTKIGSKDYANLFKESEDGKPLTDLDVRRFINRQNFLNKRLHGIYNSVDASVIQKYALGRLGIMFRKYMKPGWNRRYAKLTYNEEGEIWTEGNYNTMFAFFFGRVNKETKKREGGLVREIGWAKFQFIKHYKELNEMEKANVMRSLTEVAYVLGAVTLGAALTQMADDDDDNWWLNLAAYESYRLYSELRLYSSITEFQRLTKSPAAAIYQWDAINRFLQVWNWNEEYKSGRYKGYTHFERGVTDLAPFAGTYVKFRTPEEQLRYFVKSGVTIF